MSKRDPEKTARNKKIKEYTDILQNLLHDVLNETQIRSEQSLHGIYGGKFAEYIDIENEVIYSSDHFISLYLEGFKKTVENSKENSAHYRNLKLLNECKILKEYLYIFLKRVYLRNYEALSKRRPLIEEAVLWIGQNNANYGILITPRFNKRINQWENDKSEIRHFKNPYWTIGHILETGLVVPGRDEKISFHDINDYLSFFKNVLVRNSGSIYELEIAKKYCIYVHSSPDPRCVPLLIPELRYDGLSNNHKYRLDFTIIDPIELTKIGFELSPWSTHGYLAKVKELTQKEINKMAKDNFEKEMEKHKEFYRKYGIFTLIYTDSDLNNLDKLFLEMKNYLEPKSRAAYLNNQIIHDILDH